MIYADHNATSPVSSAVKDYLCHRLGSDGIFANPNSLHSLGKKVGQALESSRKICAQELGANTDQVIFNSGSSEGLSHVFYSVLNQSPKKTIVTSEQEHAAVEKACRHYQSHGYRLKRVRSLPNGLLDLKHFKEILGESSADIALVSLISANNETGVIHPYQEIGGICQKLGVSFLADTTQLLGKKSFNFNNLPIDYAVLSGHKLGAMTGVGLVLAKTPETLLPFIYGGDQEGGKRAGTQNYLAIETLAVALKECHEKLPQAQALGVAKQNFENKIRQDFPNIMIFGDEAPRLEGTTLMGYRGIHGQAVQLQLESYNIFVTTSSACSDNEPETSRILKSMGISDDLGRSAIRISLKNGQDPTDYQVIYDKLKTIYSKLNKIRF